jgi:hypothetical protein
MELPALTPALKLLVPAEAVIISAPSAKVTSAAKFYSTIYVIYDI